MSSWLNIFVFINQAKANGIHRAPIVITGEKIRYATGFPLDAYRLFRTNADGKASLIPFQIDEVSNLGDYILPSGQNANQELSNGVFNLSDELAFMGEDVGPAVSPRSWPIRKPDLVYELRYEYFAPNDTNNHKTGAVYLGIYYNPKGIPYSNKQYVVFDYKANEVRTSRYIYRFDPRNYLAVRGVELLDNQQGNIKQIPLINRSTFYLKADLKYFLTFEINESNVNSYLDAYKAGPVRTIVRINFFYRFLKINFELGMYTEVSLFSNAVFLPAVMANPLDGPKVFNEGSGFYYGFATKKNPAEYTIQTNIPKYPKKEESFFGFFSQKEQVYNKYWLYIFDDKSLLYMEVLPSYEMIKNQNTPQFYQQNMAGDELVKKVPADKALPLGKAAVNLAMYFDLTKFKEGEHRLAMRLFIDNDYSASLLKEYQTINNWSLQISRL